MRVKVLDSFCRVFVDWLANLSLFHKHRAVKEKWSQHEATSAVLMFLNEKQRKRWFISFSGENSSREDFLVWCWSWSFRRYFRMSVGKFGLTLAQLGPNLRRQRNDLRVQIDAALSCVSAICTSLCFLHQCTLWPTGALVVLSFNKMNEYITITIIMQVKQKYSSQNFRS